MIAIERILKMYLTMNQKKSPVDVADEEEEAEEGADEQHHCRLLGKHKS